MEKCEDCTEEAGYICICQEEYLCSECIIKHITGDKSLQHRTVSLTHPLLSLMLETMDESGENLESDPLQATSNIDILKEFRNKCIEMIDSKIRSLEEQENSELESIHVIPVPMFNSQTPNPCESHNNSYFIHREALGRSGKHLKVQRTGDSQYHPGSIYRQSLPMTVKNEQFLYKVVVCGSEKVGKTCIISSFKHVHEGIIENTSLLCKSINFENLKVSLEITETRSGGNSANALGAIVVFDLTNRESLMEAENTINVLENTNPVLGVIILVGTRLDLVVSNPKRRISSFASIQKFAINRKVFYDEISAVNYSHVEELFMRLIRELYKKSNSLS